MNSHQPFQVVDLFAGPGGLGEGFSSLNNGHSFNIIVSAEADPAARETLKLRAFYRALKTNNPDALDDYYKFCEKGGDTQAWSSKSKKEWQDADSEARPIRLGSVAGNAELDQILEGKLDTSKPWVLIGGPPCQAYSIVGRSRNKGNAEYKAEDDHRHFLYKEYLRIIQSKRPAIFVMENVKGILSSKVGGEHIFPQILKDLADPDTALGVENPTGLKYRICSLVTDDIYESGDDPADINFSNFIIRSENYGIPQARHRVILVGISEQYAESLDGHALQYSSRSSVGAVLGKLPRLRSTLTKVKDGADDWHNVVFEHLRSLHKSLKLSGKTDPLLETSLGIVMNSFDGRNLSSGALRLKRNDLWSGSTGSDELDAWYLDDDLKVWLNHEARGHMSADLRRYVYASTFARAHQWSPKGHQEFNLPGLAPEHKNWESGKFCDRFKVQMEEYPSSTITSHISKDGHHFIHYDPAQCRSLTVREAARLQTFPDNYFFLGTRTQQYHQVGNAVPPLLAYRIANVIEKILNREQSSLKSMETKELALV